MKKSSVTGAATSTPAENVEVTAEYVLNLTPANIANLGGAGLVAAFNALSPPAPVKRFATPADGRKRLAAAITARRFQAETAKGVTPETKKATLAAKGKEAAAKIAKGAGPDVDTRLARLNGEKLPTKTKGAGKSGKLTIAGRCRELLAKGMGNAEIWVILQPEFKLPDSKHTYPAYYRRKEAAKGNTWEVKK